MSLSTHKDYLIETTLSDEKVMKLYDISNQEKFICLKLKSVQTAKFWKIFQNYKSIISIIIDRYVNEDALFGTNQILKENPLKNLRINDRDKFQMPNEDDREESCYLGDYIVEKKTYGTRIVEETKEFYLEKLDFLKTLGLNKTLSLLSLEYVKLDTNSLKLLQKFVINNSSLAEIYLKKNEIETLEPFYDEMKTTSTLKNLYINENDKLALDFKFFTFHKNLVKFGFSQNQKVDFFEYINHVSNTTHPYLKYTDVDFHFENLTLKKYPFQSLDFENYKFELSSSQISSLLNDLKDLELKSINLGSQKHFNVENAYKMKDLLIQSKSIKKLMLENLGMNDEIFSIICDGIEKNESLQKLDLTNNPICKSLKRLIEVFKGKNLQKFVMFNNKYYDKINYHEFSRNMNSLITFFTNLGLKKIKLVNCNLDDDSAELLSKLIKKTHYLQHLNISKNLFESKGVQLILEAMESNKTILKFKIGDSNLNKSGKFILKILENNNYLKYLDIRNSIFSQDDYLSMIKGLGMNQSLQTFLSNKAAYYNIVQSHFNDYLYYNYSLKKIELGRVDKIVPNFLEYITVRNQSFTKTLSFKPVCQDMDFQFI